MEYVAAGLVALTACTVLFPMHCTLLAVGLLSVGIAIGKRL